MIVIHMQQHGEYKVLQVMRYESCFLKYRTIWYNRRPFVQMCESCNLRCDRSSLSHGSIKIEIWHCIKFWVL